MDEKIVADNVLIVMKILNFFIILCILVVMAYSLTGHIIENSALDFLVKAPGVPITAWKLLVMGILLYASLLSIMCIQTVSTAGLLWKVCLEIGVGFFISYILGFGYTGIVLLILANTMKNFPNSKWRFPFAVLICLVYLFMDRELLVSWFHVTPMENYLDYYRGDIRSHIQVIINVIVSANTFIFLVYMILLVRIQMNEKEKMKSLNEKLNAANAELRQAYTQLEIYSKEAEKVVETRERNRLAREIHDTLGHALTGIITGIEACTALMDVAPDATKIQMKAIADVARQGMTDVRRSVNALRPDALEKFNLKEALINVVEEMRSATGAEIEYHCSTSLNGFNQDEEEIIYRIVQESITNAIRHGKASHVGIDISRDYHLLKIVIRDNGAGCKNVKKGFGLHHMEERLDMLQGKLHYNGEDGFVVEAEIPLRWGAEGEND